MPNTQAPEMQESKKARQENERKVLLDKYAEKTSELEEKFRSNPTKLKAERFKLKQQFEQEKEELAKKHDAENALPQADQSLMGTLGKIGRSYLGKTFIATAGIVLIALSALNPLFLFLLLPLVALCFAKPIFRVAKRFWDARHPKTPEQPTSGVSETTGKSREHETTVPDRSRTSDGLPHKAHGRPFHDGEAHTPSASSQTTSPVVPQPAAQAPRGDVSPVAIPVKPKQPDVHTHPGPGDQ